MKIIRLEPGAFTEELLTLVGTDKVGWSSDNHGHLVDALLPRLRDENNEAFALDGLYLDVVKLILHPTEELQHKVLKQVFEALEVELEKKTGAAFVSLFDPVRFGNFLSEKMNPQTGKPYIKKATRAQKKKDLDALFEEESPTQAPAASAENSTLPNQPEWEVVPPPTKPPVTPPKPPKPPGK